MISELATDETLSIEDSVVRVHSDLILGGISDKTFGVAVWRENRVSCLRTQLIKTDGDLREGDVGRSGSVTLVL